MPKLDPRLIAVKEMIWSKTHADIGSDHGGLLVELLDCGRIEFGIAIENNLQPFENSQRALSGLAAEVRLGDGLGVLSRGEVDSISICGMGAKTMLRILDAHPDRLPDKVVLQPNRHAEFVRGWGLSNGFHLQQEFVSRGHWPYAILCFARGGLDVNQLPKPDVAYNGLDRDAALLFGPHELRRDGPMLESQLLSLIHI